MRLDKFLSYALGVSRSDARKIIASGRVQVGERTILKGDYYIDENRDEIRHDGMLLRYRQFVYLMVNKPRGYVTATHDALHPAVTELAGEYAKYGLFMAGRLDIDTEGFVLLTNDGRLAHAITRPLNRCLKKYYLETEEGFTEDDVRYCREGLVIRDGKGSLVTTLPAELEIVNGNAAYLTIYEGKYHQIKQMCHLLGKTLRRLVRVQIGPIPLDPALKPGEYRELTDAEINKLKNQFT